MKKMLIALSALLIAGSIAVFGNTESGNSKDCCEQVKSCCYKGSPCCEK